MGQHNPNRQWDMHGHSLFLLTPARARGTSISPKVLQKRLLLHKQAKEARVWVEAEDRASIPGLQGPRGMSTPLHHRLSVMPRFPVRPDWRIRTGFRVETIYWDSLPVFFFRAELIPVGILTIFVITKHHLHIQRNYHRSGIH